MTNMICHVMKKEILENLLSLRFVLSFLLVIALFAVSGFVFVNQYKQQLNDYRNHTNKEASVFRECAGSLSNLAFRQQSILRKPKTLRFCADGFEQSLPNLFKINVFKIEYPEVKSPTNFLLGHFINIDWVFIFSLIFSFVGLIFTYDTICGEKEAGTLRLMIAASINRHKILLGKYIGVMLTLGIPLFLGLLINLLIVVSSKNVMISASDWLKIFTILLLSFLYLSVFVLLGMFVSSRTTYSTNSMVILLLLWAGFVILTPGLGRIFSTASGEIPSRPELTRKIREAEDRIWANREKYATDASILDDQGRYFNPKDTARFYNAITELRNRLFEGYINQIIAQANTGRRFIQISPAAIYQSASETIVGTGVNRFWNLYQQLKRYQKNLKEFVISTDQLDPDSHHALFDRQGDGRPYISQQPVDFNTVPRFQEQQLTLGQSLKLAIWDVGLLVLFNMAFFTAAFASFLKYDVR